MVHFCSFAMLPLIWYNWLGRLLLGTLSVDSLLLLNMESEIGKYEQAKGGNAKYVDRIA